MYARSAVIEVPTGKTDEAVQHWMDAEMPKYREQSGYRGFTLLIDRANGKALGVSFWEDADAAAASGEVAAAARKALTKAVSGSEQPYATWEVALREDA